MSAHIDIQERPFKRMCLAPTLQWKSLPSEIFFEIFEDPCRYSQQNTKTLSQLCLVCKPWKDYSIRLKLKLANVHGVCLHSLFGYNHTGIYKFIKNHRHQLYQLHLPFKSKIIKHLPNLQLTQLQTLKIANWAKEVWQWIVDLPKLSTLKLSAGVCPYEELSSELAHQILADIARMSLLTELDAGNMCGYIDENLTMLTSLTALKSFHCSLILKEADLQILSLYTELTSLDLDPILPYTAECCRPLSSLTKLTHLSLDANHDAVDIQFVEHLVNLEELSISDIVDLGDRELTLFACMTNLRKLELCYWDLDGFGFQFLEPLTQLESLSLVSCSQIELEHVAHLTSLKSFECQSFYDEDLPLLASLNNLQTLAMHNIEEGANWHFLNQLTALDGLYVVNSMLSAHAMHAIAGISSLKRLQLDKCRLEDAFFMGELSALIIRDCQFKKDPFFCPSLLGHVSKLNLANSAIQTLQSEAFSTKLVELNLKSVPAIDDKVILHLVRLTSLEKLHLGGCAISTQQLLKLTALRSLKVLTITALQVSQAALKSAFSYIRGLSLST